MSDRSMVSLVCRDDVVNYPSNPPFNSDKIYPEFEGAVDIDINNPVYSMIWESFFQLGYDKENFNSNRWNPLRHIIKPGNSVVIKPSLVKDVHRLGLTGVLSMVTHGSVLRPIIDCGSKALGGTGEIIVCDVSLEKANFENVIELTGIAKMVQYLNDEKKCL